VAIPVSRLVGGLITQTLGWQWAFYVNLPIGVVLIALIVRVIKSSKDPDSTRLDLPGVVCFGSALLLTTLALIEGNRRGWTDRWILSELLCAVILFALFIVVERRQSRPMLDLSYFRKSTYVGANLAQFAFAAGMLSMLTFIPIFLQTGLGQNSASAGLMTLPMVLPLFVVPRIVARHLSHRLSGRALLTAGLMPICLGLLALGCVVRTLAYAPLVAGMLTTGIGAGLLNGETTKVGMTVIPKERSGMASGVSGTVRFSGLVIGITSLGVVLYSRVTVAIAQAFPDVSASERLALVRTITAGRLGSVTLAAYEPSQVKAIAVASFAAGYQALFIAAALFMLVSTILTWRLVSSIETPPIPLQTTPGHSVSSVS